MIGYIIATGCEGSVTSVSHVCLINHNTAAGGIHKPRTDIESVPASISRETGLAVIAWISQIANVANDIEP